MSDCFDDNFLHPNLMELAYRHDPEKTAEKLKILD
jgi:hypothetical protein